MNVTPSLGTLMAAFAWCSLLIVPFVVRYINMPSKLYELASKGDTSLVAAHIEDSELVPAIVSLIQLVIAARDQKVAQGQNATYQEILAEVDFRPSMRSAQQALTKIRDIDVTIDSLTASARAIWLIGLFHLFTVVGAALDLLLIAEPWRFPLLIIAATAAALSLILALWLIIKFEFGHSALLRQLRTNRGR